MGLTTTEKNAIADLMTGRVSHVSLHSGPPGATGVNELAGGAPAYARKAVVWAAAAAGHAENTGALVFDVPATAAVKFVGFWTALAAGTFRGWFPAGSDVTMLAFTADVADVFTAPGHALAAGDEVMLIDTAGSGLPTGVTEDVIYFVRDVVGSTFKLAATSGGAAIDITAIGAGMLVTQTTETFGAQGTYTIPANGIQYGPDGVS